MQTKYFGKIEDLKLLVMSGMISGDWEDQDDKWIFRSYSGGILNWWPSTGTVQFQGKADGKVYLKRMVLTVLSSGQHNIASADYDDDDYDDDIDLEY